MSQENIINEANVPKCKYLDCNEDCYIFPLRKEYESYCSFHFEGGIFGTGESYEQYQIIENDFVNFIKNVPLCKEHLGVHSPILRDIIIRTCVQIEIFLKEWAKELCSSNLNHELMKKYNDGGVKKWTIKDYYIFSSQINKYPNGKIHVMPINIDIKPFKDWTEDKPMKWWSIYNRIKHSGHMTKKESTLENALYSLAGLFQLHCVHRRSLLYLKSFSQISISGTTENLILTKNSIATPLDSKKYLFKANGTGGEKFNIATMENLSDIGKKKRI
jgi:hypothetical protein